MPVFEYSGQDSSGKQVRGHIVGESLDMVSRRLADQGLVISQLGMAQSMGDPLSVSAGSPVAVQPSVREPSRQPEFLGDGAPPTEARHRFETDFVGPLVGGVSLGKLHFFFRQLGAMLNAGIEVRQALETLGMQSEGKLRSVLMETRDHVAAGRPMSAGFQRYPEVFSPLMMALVRAGEKGGMMGDQCVRLADYIQRDIELRNLIRRETFYPKLVFGASIVIILGANFVINWLAPGASGIGVPKFLWLLVTLAVIAIFIFRKFLLRQPGVKQNWDAFLIAIPFIGPMVHGFSMAMFGRAFGALYEAGVPMTEALKLGADSANNEAVRAKIYPVVNRLDAGAGVHETFAMSGAFTPVVLDMVRTGEMTGNMNEMLIKVSEFYEDEGQTKAKQGASLFGVFMLLLVGAYVAYIVIKFYTGFAADRTTI
jgi:type II secretory pathway component PulF